MHELDGLAVRREGPVGRAFGSRPARALSAAARGYVLT